MKGLFIASLVLIIFIAVGIGVGVIITVDINRESDTTFERGYEQGHGEGYLVGFQEGNRQGFQDGSKIGYRQGREGHYTSKSDNRTNFYFVYKPIYHELQEILAESKIGSAKELHDYMEGNGIRTAYVRGQIAHRNPDGAAYVYEMIGVETMDRGLIVIEPWSLREVKLEVGKHYAELNSLTPLGWYDDTITKVTIVW